MSPASVPCRTVSGILDDLLADAPAKYAACQALPLRCTWDGPNARPREAGVAHVGTADEGLSFRLLYEDSDIFSTATADQQKMWTLGDVAELFVKPGRERPDYWEIHVTPNDFLMDLYIPDRERFMDGQVTWDEAIAPASGTQKQVAVGQGRWAVEAVVPWSAFGGDGPPAAGTVWQFAVCRYNYNGGLEAPELSSTAAFTQRGFHRHEEFTDFVF